MLLGVSSSPWVPSFSRRMAADGLEEAKLLCLCVCVERCVSSASSVQHQIGCRYQTGAASCLAGGRSAVSETDSRGGGGQFLFKLSSLLLCPLFVYTEKKKKITSETGGVQMKRWCRGGAEGSGMRAQTAVK